MNRENFNAWAERAAAKQDSTTLLLEAIERVEERSVLIEKLREKLNGT